MIDVSGIRIPPTGSWLTKLNKDFAANYPERLKRTVVYPVPWFAQKIISGMLRFVYKETREKFSYINDIRALEAQTGRQPWYTAGMQDTADIAALVKSGLLKGGDADDLEAAEAIVASHGQGNTPLLANTPSKYCITRGNTALLAGDDANNGAGISLNVPAGASSSQEVSIGTGPTMVHDVAFGRLLGAETEGFEPTLITSKSTLIEPSAADGAQSSSAPERVAQGSVPFTAEEAGTVVLLFDNTFSMLRSKTVSITVDLAWPQEQLAADEEENKTLAVDL
jgi:hypothetical protein